jgi:hypothetical protein
VLLGAPLRGVLYGLAPVVVVPMAWLDGRVIPAVVVGGLALIGVALEILTSRRR